MALTANPKSAKWFLADGYRRKFGEVQVQRQLFGDRAKWQTWLANLDQELEIDANRIGLGAKRRRSPTKTIPEWPTPGGLTRARRRKGRKRPLPILLRGNRARLFKEAYLWYSHLSSYAHQRSAAVQLAIFSHNSDNHGQPGAVESDEVSQALLFYSSTMSELEAASGMPPCADLRALWSELWDLDEEAKRFIDIRYRHLLRLPRLN